MNIRLLVVALCAVWCTACRSTQLPAFFPAAQQYQPYAALPAPFKAEVLAHAPTTRAIPTRVLLREPAVASGTVSPRAGKTRSHRASLPIVSTPDTVKARSPKADQPLTDPPVDPATNGVNVMGGLLAATGLAMLFVGANNDEGSGWGGVFLGLIALALIPVGIALLFYQGKNGRLRLKREARRRARTNASPPVVVSNPTTKGPRNIPMRRLGVGLLIAGGVLLIIGALTVPYGLILFGLPGFVSLIIGLVLAVAAT